MGLQDLGDVEGWQERGDGLYLFELRGGVYKRVALPELPPPEVHWLLDFRLMNPFVHVRLFHRVSKWQNSASILASLIPRDVTRLIHKHGLGYALYSVKKTSRLHLVGEFEALPAIHSSVLAPGSTLVILLALDSPPAKALKLVKGGIKIEWDGTATGKRVGVVVRTPSSGGDKDPPYVTRKDVRVKVEDAIDISQFILHSPGYSIMRVLMTDALPELSAVERYLH